MQINETHENIVNILREKGPSLPINLAKELEMSSLFISAFLSELTNQKRINVSHLKIGGSPLYFVDGQEDRLEPYYKYLHPKEAETFLTLKKRKILKDSEQEPAARVALRSIRDFAVEFKMGEEIYWRYFLVEDSEVNDYFEPKPKEVEVRMQDNTEITVVESEIKESQDKRIEATDVEIKKAETNEGQRKFTNPLVLSEKGKKQKPKSDFVVKTIKFLKSNNFEITEERDYKPKEYHCLIKINSELGSIQFFTQAKDKKAITEGDVKKLLSDAQSIPLPAFLVYTGEISKKAKDYLNSYSSIFKAKRME